MTLAIGIAGIILRRPPFGRMIGPLYRCDVPGRHSCSLPSTDDLGRGGTPFDPCSHLRKGQPFGGPDSRPALSRKIQETEGLMHFEFTQTPARRSSRTVQPTLQVGRSRRMNDGRMGEVAHGIDRSCACGPVRELHWCPTGRFAPLVRSVLVTAA
jgi:hypothetical protein